MSIPCAVLMCHAPIVVPEIGGARASECARTSAAMRDIARTLLAHEPEAVVIISPHTPRDPLRFGVVQDAWLSGDFGQFGAAGLQLRLPGAPALAEQVERCASALGLQTWNPKGTRLDHGALVPLHFLCEAGWRGPTLLLSLPYPGTDSETTMGRAIADAAERLGQRVGILASGDMSHRLMRGAPAGFHPRAREFDARFADLIARGELQAATSIDPMLRELAAEDVVDSCAVASAAVSFDARGHRVASYEGPFGVGYLEAVLHEAESVRTRVPHEGAAEDAKPPAVLLNIARGAITHYLRGEPQPLHELAAPWDRSRGVFVTLRTLDGELRGCIGHLAPTCASLGDEIAKCAISSAIRDTRFTPVTVNELEDLRIELSLLDAPQPVTDVRELDPKRYGVIVSCGTRRGVLLPDIDGVDSTEQQVRIAAAKAGLSLRDPLRLQRFEVQKLAEPEGRASMRVAGHA